MENIKEIIKKGFKNGYSKEHKITDIMYELFPNVDLIYNDREHKMAEEIYNYYVEEWYLCGE